MTALELQTVRDGVIALSQINAAIDYVRGGMNDAKAEEALDLIASFAATASGKLDAITT